MKVFTTPLIRDADAYTIRHLPISSTDLMEKAATACAHWICSRFPATVPVCVFCGTGNNGGDGLAVTRLLRARGYTAQAWLVTSADRLSPDCAINRERLEQAGEGPVMIRSATEFPLLPAGALVVDALLGTGLTRPLSGLMRDIVLRINDLHNPVISVDIPSGMYADQPPAKDGITVRATHTLSFMFYKLAFLLPASAPAAGKVTVLPIGLHPDYIAETPTPYQTIDARLIRRFYKKRAAFSHKGTYGHALLAAGSFGKMGAALLSARACLCSGAGLLSCRIPRCGYIPLQTALPEAMCLCDEEETHLVPGERDDTPYQSIGIGPGIGQHPDTVRALEQLLQGAGSPVVLDADALNILARHPELWKHVPAGSLLTPHPKEFERLFGPDADDFARLEKMRKACAEHSVYIILKGHHSCTCTPEGNFFFNTSGNAGMATAGSGDTLTGILTGLLAQRYTPLETALLGTYIHGRAGDHAAAALSPESMLASDIIDHLGAAFLEIAGTDMQH
ncbi:NAD(P)H-hydrate dehydratase [Compostibacter hankyongensis]|uniref:Bifunctional NAD(P)H-hydrate repair enzyme n=1 Tax=Compostibacter hankyongensis TaxID=1007089 RepID=A0ABP8FPY7_9BACT